MSQNSQKIYDYLQANDPNPEVFGDFYNFNEDIKNPDNAERLRLHLND